MSDHQWGSFAVYKSTDGGETWRSTGLRNSNAVSFLTIDPATPTTIYAATNSSDGVYKSLDGGDSWQAASTGLPQSIPIFKALTALVIAPTTPPTLYAGTWEDRNSGRVFKSTDGGSTWHATGLFGGVHTLAIDPTTPTTLYAATVYGAEGNRSALFKSTDGGDTWTNPGVIFENASATMLVIDPKTPSTVYMGSDNGMFKSTDGGSTWGAINTAVTVIHALAIDPQTPTTL